MSLRNKSMVTRTEIFEGTDRDNIDALSNICSFSESRFFQISCYLKVQLRIWGTYIHCLSIIPFFWTGSPKNRMEKVVDKRCTFQHRICIIQYLTKKNTRAIPYSSRSFHAALFGSFRIPSPLFSLISSTLGNGWLSKLKSQPLKTWFPPLSGL